MLVVKKAFQCGGLQGIHASFLLFWQAFLQQWSTQEGLVIGFCCTFGLRAEPLWTGTRLCLIS